MIELVIRSAVVMLAIVGFYACAYVALRNLKTILSVCGIGRGTE